VAHACNLSYSGGRYQEDSGWKSAQENSLGDPILKKKITKKSAGGVAQGIGPEFKPQYSKEKKKKKDASDSLVVQAEQAKQAETRVGLP
jgi:hypothetical protein